MTASDTDDIWGTYAKGVRRIGEKPPEPEIKRKPKKPAPEEKPLWDMPPQTLVAIPEPKEDVVVPVRVTAPPWKKEPLDLRVERNMSLGDVVIEAKLDLHGQTEQAAYDAFSSFVETQQARGKRLLLVITGRGAEGASVLRANLPRWCDTPPFDSKVMAVRSAAQHHGGEGAYYVLLKKRL